MTIQWGEEYRGTGCADPAKTRAEREKELQAMLETAAGKQVIEYYFRKYTGASERGCPPAGLLMVQTILNREYPHG